MYNIDLLELILEFKEKELQEKQAEQSDVLTINDIKKEIEYLKTIKVRYEIAKILKLDKNTEWVKKDFIGIENENLDNYSLTLSDKVRCYNLISSIPSEQISRYKIREQIRDLLCENNKNNISELYQIEKVNPTLPFYALKQTQIDRFYDLTNKINKLERETTKKIDCNQAALKIIRDNLTKLDSLDIEEYDKEKDAAFETIDKVLNVLVDAKNKLKLTNISNYELAKSLKNKYPNSIIIMNIKGIEKLLNEIKNNNISEEKYEEYIQLAADNINKLYEENSSKDKLENLINSIPNENYILRDSLSKHLRNIENVNIKIDSQELKNIMEYLDNNYDTTDEKKIDKYYNIIKNIIEENKDDLNKITDINKIILSVNNKKLKDRLTSDFSKYENMQVQNKHKDAYKELVQDTIRKLEEQKTKFLNKKTNSVIKSSYYDIKINEIDKKIEYLKSLDLNYEDTIVVSMLDDSYNEKTDKVIKLEKEIKMLKELKEQVNSNIHKKILEKRIAKKTEKIEKLKKSKINIIGIQKKMMVPTFILNKRKGNFSRHFESKKEVFEKYSKDYQKMAQSERELDGMLNGIKALLYESKAKKYHNKAMRNQIICELLKKGSATIKGRNKHQVKKSLLNNFIQNLEQNLVAQQTI